MMSFGFSFHSIYQGFKQWLWIKYNNCDESHDFRLFLFWRVFFNYYFFFSLDKNRSGEKEGARSDTTTNLDWKPQLRCNHVFRALPTWLSTDRSFLPTDHFFCMMTYMQVKQIIENVKKCRTGTSVVDWTEANLTELILNCRGLGAPKWLQKTIIFIILRKDFFLSSSWLD